MAKKLAIFLLVMIAALPAGNVIAQDAQPLPAECEVEVALNELEFRLENLQTFEDAAELIDFLATLVANCSDAWLDKFFDAILDAPAPKDETALDPDDGILTEAEAVFAIEAAFNGDIETANQYICPDEQILPEEAEALPPNMETLITIEGCTANGDRMHCEITFTFEGMEIENSFMPFDFSIVDGKLCAAELSVD